PAIAFGPDQIYHNTCHFALGTAQWQIQDGPDMLFKLIGIAGFYTVMTAIMWPGGNFVHQDFVIFRPEHLNSQKSHMFYCFRDLQCYLDGPFRYFLVDSGG